MMQILNWTKIKRRLKIWPTNSACQEMLNRIRLKPMDLLTSELSVGLINGLQLWTHSNLKGHQGRLVIQSLEKRTQVTFASQIPSSASKARETRIMLAQTISRKLAQKLSSMIKVRNSRLALVLIKIVMRVRVKPAPKEHYLLSITWLKSKVGLSISSLKIKL